MSKQKKQGLGRIQGICGNASLSVMQKYLTKSWFSEEMFLMLLWSEKKHINSCFAANLTIILSIFPMTKACMGLAHLSKFRKAGKFLRFAWLIHEVLIKSQETEFVILRHAIIEICWFAIIFFGQPISTQGTVPKLSYCIFKGNWSI